MKQIKLFTLVLFTLLISTVTFAQVIIDGELRPRTEYSHGYGTLAAPEQDASLFTTQRTRLNINFKSDLFNTHLTLQDVRLWGNQPQLVGNQDNATSIHQAWAELKLFNNAYLKAGRQEVVYDNHRIFGNVGWAQQARSHDMVIFKYEGNFKAHFALAYHQNADRTNNIYEGPDAYKALQLVWLQKKFGDIDVSLMFLNNGKPFTEETDTLGNITKQSIKYSQTVGPRISYSAGDLILSANFYYQGGKDAGDNDLSAFEFNVEGIYKVSDAFKTTVGYEMLSGSTWDEADKNKSFTPFYGTNHKFNGFMDYFYVGNHMNNVGLSDFYIKGRYGKGKFWAAGHLHFFSAAAEIAADMDNYLGTELDLWAGYNMSKQANIKFGYSQMFATTTMEALKGGNKGEVQNWAWVMLTFKPKFLDTTPK